MSERTSESPWRHQPSSKKVTARMLCSYGKTTGHSTFRASMNKRGPLAVFGLGRATAALFMRGGAWEVNVSLHVSKGARGFPDVIEIGGRTRTCLALIAITSKGP